MIGGTDVVLEIGPGVAAADAILRAVRRHWPHCVYQNADDETAPFAPVADWPPRSVEREFFVYRDEDAARDWDAEGATEANHNTMLYVILPDESPAPSDRPTVTVVCGEPTGDVKAILEDIETSLRLDRAGGNGVGGVRGPDAALRE